MIDPSSDNPMSRLIHRLDLERIDSNRFRGFAGSGEGRVFGGMVAAQALVAAGRTVDASLPYSVHVHFLRPGRYGEAIEWSVDELRDGQSHSTRHVTGFQLGKPIATLTASFSTRHPLRSKTSPEGKAPALAHQDEMPTVPPPHGLPDWDDLRFSIRGGRSARRALGPFELRDCEPESAHPKEGTPARRAFWIRGRGDVPEGPLLNAALLVFASDRGVLSTAGRPHGLLWDYSNGASLDHTVWLHHPPRIQGWILSVTHSPVAAEGRALVFGAMYSPDGRRIASIAQEGLIRKV